MDALFLVDFVRKGEATRAEKPFPSLRSGEKKMMILRDFGSIESNDTNVIQTREIFFEPKPRRSIDSSSTFPCQTKSKEEL